MVLLYGLKKLLLAIQMIDYTADKYHFASFISALLCDFAYWRVASVTVQSGVISLLKLFVNQNVTMFMQHSSIGIARMIDSIRVLQQSYLTPNSLNVNGISKEVVASPVTGAAAATASGSASVSSSPTHAERSSPTALDLLSHPLHSPISPSSPLASTAWFIFFK